MHVEVSVWNEGPPIFEALKERIWAPFYKADHTRAEPDALSEAGFEQGSGLGLSIVRQILLLHGSDFGVENDDNGVRFYFLLKREEDERHDGEVWKANGTGTGEIPGYPRI